MYVFARSRRVNPAHRRAAVAMAAEAATRGGEILGRPVMLWEALFTDENGTLLWSIHVDHLDEALAANDALTASSEFSDWVEDNDGLFSGPFIDTVSEVLHGTPTLPPPAFVQVTRAVCAHGAIGEAMAVGVELAETASRITGYDTLFVAPAVGTSAAVGWLTGFPDLAAKESADAALRSDEGWIKLVDRAGPAFQPGVSRSLMRRLN